MPKLCLWLHGGASIFPNCQTKVDFKELLLNASSNLEAVMKYIAMLTTTLGAVLMFSLMSAQAQSSYGAIAYSPATGAHGYSYDFNSRRTAEKRALNGCFQHANDCFVVVWFENACGALAVGNNGYGYGWAGSRAGAERHALNGCFKNTRNCGIRRWVCSGN